MSPVIGRWTRVRVILCGGVMAVGFIGMARRAVSLQVGPEAERMRALAEEQYLRDIELPPRRGRILDRNGAELASTAEVDSIYCNPRRLVDARAAAQALATALRMAPAERKELFRRLSQRRYFAWIKRKVAPEEVQAVQALGIPGVAFTREPRRFYPNRTLAANVMGHSGADGHGLDGVELAFDKQLRGQTSSVQGVRDALGRELFVEGMGEAAAGAGSDVFLTVDRYLTYVTERAIAEAQARHNAKAVMAVMIDPQTGDILAMGSVPTYNPNDPSGVSESGARNRAITDAFEPGSTMKTFTIAAALEAKVVRPDDRFDCMMGKMPVGKYIVHDTHPHGVLTVAEIFKVSSNIGVTKVARRLGRDGLAIALASFGFGRPTGVGLPGERGGLLRAPERWGDIGFANVSFGQGMTATPLQIVSAVGAIAAAGVYHPPRIVARVVGPDGTSSVPVERPARTVLSPATARQMIAIMKGVTQPGGTARAAAIDGYSVAGKTGTAQKVAGGRYDPNKWVSSFVGFAPADDPRVAIVVMVDEPQGGHLGGAVAAPIFKEIAEQALRYLHVPPSPELLASARAATSGQPVGAGPRGGAALVPAASIRDAEERPGTEVASVADGGAERIDDSSSDDLGGGIDDDADYGTRIAARATAFENGAPAEQDGRGNGLDGEPAGEAGAAKRERPEMVMIPDFRRLSIAAAIRAARRAGVTLSFEEAAGQRSGSARGPSGVALRQRPAPGLVAPPAGAQPGTGGRSAAQPRPAHATSRGFEAEGTAPADAAPGSRVSVRLTFGSPP